MLDLLPEIILYLASGYIFIKTFCFMSAIKMETSAGNLLIEITIIGFVLSLGYKFFPSIAGGNEIADITLFLLICLSLAVIAAKIRNSRRFRLVCRKLGVLQTVNEFVWDEIIDDSYPVFVRVASKELDVDYIGQLFLLEDFQRQPLIAIGGYRKCSYDGTIVEDHSGDPTERALIDTSKFEIVELVFDKKSKRIK